LIDFTMAGLLKHKERRY